MPTSVRDLLLAGTEKLKPVAISNARLTAEVILQSILQLKKVDLYVNPSRPVGTLQEEDFWNKIGRKLKREPLQYILGETEWFGLTLKCDARALIPRPETEIIVERALELIKSIKEPTLLDLCTGTGAIAIAMASSHPDAAVVASDISLEALELARENARLHRLHEKIEFLHGDLFAPVADNAQFDLIVSNPPYISTQEYPTLMPEVKNYEPAQALLAGGDGLDIIQKIIAQAPRYLKPQGWLVFECAIAQIDVIGETAAQSERYETIEAVVDYDSQPRGFILRSLSRE